MRNDSTNFPKHTHSPFEICGVAHARLVAAADDELDERPLCPRLAEALLGLANAFIGLGSKREACETLDDLRSNHGQQLRGALVERNTEARRRAGCR
jgi:hypothetical protein